MAGNASLRAAKAAKNDEFYTQWSDIENEMNAYLDYNQDVFRGKTVLLPCDDPEWSNFTRFFVHNFTAFGIKKLISTSCTPRGNGRIFVMESGSKSDGSIGWEYLDGDGDFRSDEVTALRDEADMAITNPPFSLFREFLAWLVEGDVQFSIIGNMNSIAGKEVFPLIKENRLWLGATGNSNDMVFRVPEGVEVRDSDRDKAARLGYPSTETEFFTRMGNPCWFSNIQHGRKNEPLKLMTMDDNLIYGSKRVREAAYPHYDNYDAIEVPETKGIPSDYDGIMGVPISFLDKYNPEQFEILGIDFQAKTGEIEGLVVDKSAEKLDRGYVNGKRLYSRIFIRHRNPERKESQLLSRSRGGRSSLRCKRELSHIL